MKFVLFSVVLLAISATDSDVNVKQQYVHDASLPNRNLHQEEFDWTLLKVSVKLTLNGFRMHSSLNV